MIGVGAHCLDQPRPKPNQEASVILMPRALYLSLSLPNMYASLALPSLSISSSYHLYSLFVSMSSTSKNVPIYPVISDTPPFALNVPGYKPVEGEGIPRRNAQFVDRLVAEPTEGINTVFDIVTRAARTFGDARAVGTRRLIKTHNEIKKVKKIVDGREQEVDKQWTYFELSEYKYLSFSEYESLVLKVGSGLRNLGLVGDDRLFIFAATRYEPSLPLVTRAHEIVQCTLACKCTWCCFTVNAHRYGIRYPWRRGYQTFLTCNRAKSYIH
jgi:hypothetical protein